MKRMLFLALLAGVCAAPLSAAPRALLRSQPLPASRASADYTLAAETLDAGGGALLSSPDYAIKDASVGAIGVLAVSAAYTVKGGYAGQLYEAQALGVTPDFATVDEGGSIPLAAAPRLDDGTLLAALASGVSWSVVSGPLLSVSSRGAVLAAIVYQDTPATVRASAGGLSGLGTLTVRNAGTDNYGSYAGDQLNDAWQVQYFGIDNPLAGPNVDADGTGQSNLFKYLAGLNPLDANSRFTLAIGGVAGQATQKTLAFSPVYSGRTYTVQSTASLTQPNWTPLTGAVVSDDGDTRTVTDLNAGGTPRFYRVLVSIP